MISRDIIKSFQFVRSFPRIKLVGRHTSLKCSVFFTFQSIRSKKRFPYSVFEMEKRFIFGTKHTEGGWGFLISSWKNEDRDIWIRIKYNLRVEPPYLQKL